jgi:eukaryotic-like serine/threonine-protein kinase
MSGAEIQPTTGSGNDARKPDRDKPFLEDGQVVGRYRIIKRIGAGAMGEVYLAADEQLGRHAAVKVLSGRHLGNSVTKERFLREARALDRHAHPNVITVF